MAPEQPIIDVPAEQEQGQPPLPQEPVVVEPAAEEQIPEAVPHNPPQPENFVMKHPFQAETSQAVVSDSDAEDSIQDNISDSASDDGTCIVAEDQPPASPVLNIPSGVDFSDVYMPGTPTGMAPGSHNIYFSDAWLDPMYPEGISQLGINDPADPLESIPDVILHQMIAEPVNPPSLKRSVTDREGESAQAAPHKAVSDHISAALPPLKQRKLDLEATATSQTMSVAPQISQTVIPMHSEAIHIEEELTAAVTLSSLSGIDTRVIDPSPDQVPSQVLGETWTRRYLFSPRLPPGRNISGSH